MMFPFLVLTTAPIFGMLCK